MSLRLVIDAKFIKKYDLELILIQVYFPSKSIIILIMRTILIFLILFLFCNIHIAKAEDDDFYSYGNVDGAWDLQKPITNADFEKAIEMKQGKKKQKKNKDGAPILTPNLDVPSSYTNDMSVLYNLSDSFPTIMISVEGYSMNQELVPMGFYRVIPSVKDKNIYLNLYQGNTLIAKLPTEKTEDDFKARELTFAKVTPVNDDYVKIVYGCIDYNVEAIILIRK